jgi:signal transduction histidine kinase
LDAHIAEQVRKPLGSPVAGTVALRRQSVLATASEISPKRLEHGYLTGSFISVPVPIYAEACGVLNVADPLQQQGFQAHDVRALERLAQKISTHLQFQYANRRVGDLELTVQQLRRQIILSQEAERKRISRDLHDEAGHALTAAVLRLDQELMRLAERSAVDALQRVREQLVECSSKLHGVAFDLRPRILEDLGLHAALRSVASRTMELADLEITVTVTGSAWSLEEIEDLVILRVVQEALTNVCKHAQASTVTIMLRYEGSGLTLQIVDDGIGVPLQARVAKHSQGGVSLGIEGMRERIELFGGKFNIRRGRNGGTRITAHLPR